MGIAIQGLPKIFRPPIQAIGRIARSSLRQHGILFLIMLATTWLHLQPSFAIAALITRNRRFMITQYSYRSRKSKSKSLNQFSTARDKNIRRAYTTGHRSQCSHCTELRPSATSHVIDVIRASLSVISHEQCQLIFVLRSAHYADQLLIKHHTRRRIVESVPVPTTMLYQSPNQTTFIIIIILLH